MDDPVSAAAAAAAHRAPSRRGVLSRGYREKYPLNELFTSHGSGGGGGSGSGSGYGLSRSGTVSGRARSATGGSSTGGRGGLARGGTSHGFRGGPGGPGGGGCGTGGGVYQDLGGGGGGPALLAGLGRCVNLLVATMRRGDGGGDAGWGVILEEREGVQGVDPVLMRALCEVVRCAEEGCEGI